MANNNSVHSRTPVAFGNYLLGEARNVNIAATGNAIATIPIMEGGLTASGSNVTSGVAIVRRITIGNYSAGNCGALNVSVGWTNDGANLVVNAATVASLTANNMFQDLTLNATANNTFINGNVSNALFFNVVGGQVANGTVDLRVEGCVVKP